MSLDTARRSACATSVFNNLHRGGCPSIRSHRNESYNEAMLPHIIGNPVPTPEEMAKILGVSPDRVAAVRRIMSTPKQQKASGNSNVRVRAGARKKSSRTTASRSDAKR
jgi:hypothetical protein